MDDRAQATGIANFGLSIVIGAVVTWIITTITTPLVEHANDAVGESDTVGLAAVGFIDTVLANQPLMFLGICFFSLLLLSIFQREMVYR